MPDDTSAGTAIGGETDGTLSVAIGDINRDSYPDLVAGNGGQNRLYPNDGNGGFLSSVPIGDEIDTTYAVHLVDVNKDGYLDLLTGNSGQSDKVYLYDSINGFPASGTAI